jgi:hypothetical protein
MDAKNIDALKARLADIYKDYDAELDAKVTAKILHYTQIKLKPNFFRKISTN